MCQACGQDCGDTCYRPNQEDLCSHGLRKGCCTLCQELESLLAKIEELKSIAYTPNGFEWRDCCGQAEAQLKEAKSDRDEAESQLEDMLDRFESVVEQNIVLREALEPFAEGSRRAGSKRPTWASSYVCPTKYALAEQAMDSAG